MAALPVKNTGPFYFQFRVLPPSPLNQLTTVALFCLILLESQETGAALGCSESLFGHDKKEDESPRL